MSGVDDIDLAIIRELDSHPRGSLTMLARQLGCARATVQARLGRLESEGHLAPHSSRVRPAAIGRSVQAVVATRIDRRRLDQTVKALEAIPEVIECFVPASEDDLLIRLAATDHDDLFRVGEVIRLVPGVVRTRTTVMLQEVIPRRLRQLID